MKINYSCKKMNVFKTIGWIFLTLLLFLCVLLFFSAKWYVTVYGNVRFEAVIYSMTNNLSSTESGLIISYVLKAALPAVGITALLSFLFWYRPKFKRILKIKKLKLTLWPLHRVLIVILCLIISVSSAWGGISAFKIPQYVETVTTPTSVFEEYYVEPTDENVIFPENKRNIIRIYLESMETTFFNKNKGGALNECAIPELYNLANHSVNFSQNSGIGGALTTSGTCWTIAGIVAQTAGIPFKLESPTGNDYSSYEKILPGVTTLSDILHKNGYYQAFMMGSNSAFASRDKFLTQHGTDKIYDTSTAVKDGIIPKGYSAWWGFEDKYLFEYAKQELLKISSSDKPFSFSMLTADTHHIGGYVCSECKNKFKEQYENVFACSSKQVNSFIKWIKKQSFYKNTVIVITGDHTSMDGEYIKRNVSDSYTRRVYNCIINSAVKAKHSKNRTFTTMDIFPTTLAAMGCTIVDDRLGLGTNLFSNRKTYSEKLGFEYLDSETAKKSSFYNSKFINGEK